LTLSRAAKHPLAFIAFPAQQISHNQSNRFIDRLGRREQGMGPVFQEGLVANDFSFLRQ
jgi:hypothetical protein